LSSPRALAHRWWWLPSLYVIFIAYQSLVGNNHWQCRPVSELFLGSMRKFSTADFLANFLAYAPLGFLLAAPRLGHRVGQGLIWALLGGFVLSLSMEMVQLCLPTRTPSLFDLFSNSLGALAGGILALVCWQVLESRVAAAPLAADHALRLKSSSLRILVLLATLTWIAHQTEPWVFSFDVGQLRSNFSWLRHFSDYYWSWYGFAQHFCAWMALLLAWRLSASVRPSQFLQGTHIGHWLRWSLISLAFATLTQIALEARAMGPEEFAAMGAALALSLAVSIVVRQEKHVQALLSIWVMVFAFATVLVHQVEPNRYGGDLATQGRADWSPSLDPVQVLSAIDEALFFAWFGVILAVGACARASSNGRFQQMAQASTAQEMGKPRADDRAPVLFVLGWKLPLVALLGLALVELAQGFGTGRRPDFLPLLFTLLGYLFANRMISRPTPIYPQR
jgi:VanZ like family